MPSEHVCVAVMKRALLQLKLRYRGTCAGQCPILLLRILLLRNVLPNVRLHHGQAPALTLQNLSLDPCARFFVRSSPGFRPISVRFSPDFRPILIWPSDENSLPESLRKSNIRFSQSDVKILSPDFRQILPDFRPTVQNPFARLPDFKILSFSLGEHKGNFAGGGENDIR